MEGVKHIRKRSNGAAGLVVADFKTPLSKEVRSTSVIVNVASSVGQAFHDRRLTKDRELNSMGIVGGGTIQCNPSSKGRLMKEFVMANLSFFVSDTQIDS
ncbi:hypothetical protein M0802_006242 [Mischocyttarus mexicanus]|nr:hypothetical protein M0802_006242 [Mischocyttarus mexicanus]